LDKPDISLCVIKYSHSAGLSSKLQETHSNMQIIPIRVSASFISQNQHKNSADITLLTAAHPTKERLSANGVSANVRLSNIAA
jgi:hypothetical protein